MKKINNTERKVVSIFSGIDVLSLGFEKNNFNVVAAVEIEKNACETLKANKEKYHPHMEIINDSVFNISDEKIQSYQGIDGLIGGAPCQPFSRAKGTFDEKDEKISCFFEYLRWVKLINPKWFVMENVKALTDKDKKYILDEFIDRATSLGYKVQYKVLNSHDYGNCQKRERIIIIGVKYNLNIEYSYPTVIAKSKRKYVKDIIIPNEDIGECIFYSKERADIMSYIPQGGNWRSLKGKHEDILKKAMGANYTKIQGGMTGAYRRLSLEDGYACPTLVTSPCQRNTLACHPLEDRPLSVKEYMRGQGIPDDYIIKGKVTEKYKFIGNAVPYELSFAIAKSISDSLYDNTHNHIDYLTNKISMVEDINNQLKFNL